MARTIRPKIHARPDFLGAIPELSPNPQGTKLPAATDWKAAEASLDLDRSVPGMTPCVCVLILRGRVER